MLHFEQGVKSDTYHKTEFISVEYPEVRQIKVSFKKLMRACVASSPTAEKEQSFHRLDLFHDIKIVDLK